MATNPEALLISSLIRKADYQVLVAQGVTSRMFHTYTDEMSWIEGYVKRKGRIPSKRAFQEAWPEFKLEHTMDTEHWTEAVRQDHRRQATIDLMDEVMMALEDDPEAAVNILTRKSAEIKTVTAGSSDSFNLFHDWDEAYGQVVDKVARVSEHGLAGVPTGFPTLDGITGGFQPGWFIVVAARLGLGKTFTGLKMAWEAAKAGRRVTYFSLEQSRFQITNRIHAYASHDYWKRTFDPASLNRGSGVDLLDYKKFLKHLDSQKGHGDFYIDDSSRGMVTPETVAAVIQSRGPEIVYIDYLTLMAHDKGDWRGVAELSNELQGVSQRYRVPVVAISQINRSGAGKEPPGAETLSQSDALGHDADLILTMSKRSQRVRKFSLEKNRHGPGGMFWYTHFDPSKGIFEEVSGDVAAAIAEEDATEV